MAWPSVYLKMGFINSTVDLTQLPAAETLSFQSLQKNYRNVLLIEWAIVTTTLLLAAVAFYFISQEKKSSYHLLIAGAVVIISSVYFLFQQKAFPLAGYAVRDFDVCYKSGWLTRSLRIIPFNRIQNCTVQSGPLERKYGVASLIIYTAGSDGGDVKIPGLLQQDADSLRQFILIKIQKEDEGI